MPLYEYQCKKCAHRFERIQKFSDRPVKKCPECGGAVEKLLSASAVHFKGSGWYATDYAKKGATSPGESGKPSDTSADSPSKTESKNESKNESKPHKSDKKK